MPQALAGPRDLAPFTTLRMGGPARLLEVTSQSELTDALRGHPDARVLGGGSNVVVGESGVPEPVVRVRSRGWRVVSGQIHVEAGTVWDEFVAETIDAGFQGLEALSGIPGTVGATPVQNVGAYGQEVASAIVGMRVFDRRTGEVRTMAAAEAGFGYRTSALKAAGGRFVVLQVAFELPRGSAGSQIGYAQLAAALGLKVGQQAPPPVVREAVLELRRSKGMVVDGSDPDSVSAGSFFTNPVVEQVPPGAPSWPAGPGRHKVSAAWLIEQAGVHRGFRLPGSRAAVSGKHTLALVNTGGATATDLLALAAHVRGAVRGRFAVQLEPEPVLWGCSLPE